jgi:hypothetical protein
MQQLQQGKKTIRFTHSRLSSLRNYLNLYNSNANVTTSPRSKRNGTQPLLPSQSGPAVHHQHSNLQRKIDMSASFAPGQNHDPSLPNPYRFNI